MFDRAERREQRLNNLEGIQLSDRAYNLTIGGMLLIGIIINAVTSQVLKNYVLSLHPLILIGGYMLLSILSSLILARTKSVAVAFAGFMVLSFSTGLLLTMLIQQYTDSTVTYAFIGTAILLAIMITLSTLNPGFFMGIGKALFISLIASIIADVIISFIFPRYVGLMDYAVIVIFAGFIGFDWARAQMYPKNLLNAIGSAADIYLDLVNIFIRLLRIFGKKD